MKAELAPFIVEGVLIVISAIFGFSLGKAGKPYGKVKLVLHLFFFAWLTMGFAFIFPATLRAMSPVVIPVVIIGLAMAVQLVAGILMLAAKEAKRTLQQLHKISALVMILADIAALIITVFK
ncbi:MAG TPA: hypothetical protein VMV83_05180 [Rectinemataceae bacterium]|nr:hypothetical protein [Rectinemataceae bacterium]